VDDSTDHTKKPDDTKKASGEKSSSGKGDTIITPLKVSIEEKKTSHSNVTQSDSVKRLYNHHSSEKPVVCDPKKTVISFHYR